MSNYTKVSNELLEDKRFNLADCVIYAKLTYRMKLSIKSNKFFDNGYYVIYKINDLSHDCGVSRNVVINSLKKLCKLGYVYKDRRMFGLRLYLPKFNTTPKQSRKTTSESHESKLTSENKNQKINNNNYVYSSYVNVNKAKFPTMTKIKKQFNPKLVNYAINHIYQKYISWGFKVYSKSHFIYGILRRWQRKGLKTLNAVMISENDKRAKLPSGPEIPIFKI